GVGAAVGGKDVILSPETQAELGAGLGVLGRQVLAEVYQRQKEVRLVAATRTMGVIDTPAFLRLNGGHRKAVIRYAFLVGPRTGRLDSLAWRIDLDDGGGYAGMGGPVEWLPPALRVRPTLHV